MSNILDKIYSSSPIWFQTIGLNIYGYFWKRRRFGGVFNEVLRQLKNREDWNLDDWNNYQNLYLKRILIHSYNTVSYYKNIFKKNKISEKHLEKFTIQDLPFLPILEKDSIRQAVNEFISKEYNRNKLYCYNTSGTTGTPISVFFDSKTHQIWSAFYEARVRNWASVNYKMRRAMIGGRLVVPKANSKPPYWRKNFVEEQLYMSAFHISPNSTILYANALNKFKPHYLVGYASSWYFLSRFILEQNIEILPVKAVLTSSEKLSSEMRETIEKAFKTKVYDAYSGVEACCLASECQFHNLHISPDTGIIEILNENGEPAKEGEMGEIVATGLINFVQPLIRYKTGDYAIFSNKTCPCGRRMPIISELVGRLEDTVVGLDGREMVRFHGLYVGIPSVIEGQVIQETISKITVRIVPDITFADKDSEEIKKRVKERLGPVEVTIQKVNSIERTERGKFRAVISYVKRSLNENNNY